jgi:hypothetical protein
VRIFFEHEAGQKNNPNADPHITTFFPMETNVTQVNVLPLSNEKNTIKLQKGIERAPDFSGERNKSYTLRKDGDCKPQDTIKKSDNDKDKDSGGVGSLINFLAGHTKWSAAGVK